MGLATGMAAVLAGAAEVFGALSVEVKGPPGAFTDSGQAL
jgi:hypothetical protein